MSSDGESSDSKDSQARRNPFREELEGATKSYLKVAAKIEERLKLLEEKEQKLAALEKRMEENAANVKQKVKLDVGGRIFATSKSSLLRFENSFFHAMISSGKWKPDEDGTLLL